MKDFNKDLNISSAEFLDTLPRLLQLHNTLKKTPDFLLNNMDNSSLLKVFKRISLPPNKYKGCGGLPKLSIEDAQIIIDIIYPQDNMIQFTLPSSINKNPKNTKLSELPGRGNTIRTVVDFYTMRRDNMVLKCYKGASQYCSSNLDFLIMDLDHNIGTGTALVSPYQRNLLLEDSNGIKYEILIKELLSKLKPFFKESYLLM